ncbi:MAG: membrane protein insertion efficiency factor YidD [Deltaproteobacteria bacterium]|nr:membrane protein insertion efficiency factor YidD [Deltaproteobacteria bacterium]
MRWLGILGILAYRLFVRPFVRRQCLYVDSCSAYAIRMLREHGLVSATPRIQTRVRSCRMPAAACYVIDENGKARLLSATGHDGEPVPPRALEILAFRAEHHTMVDHRIGD